MLKGVVFRSITAASTHCMYDPFADDEEQQTPNTGQTKSTKVSLNDNRHLINHNDVLNSEETKTGDVLDSGKDPNSSHGGLSSLFNRRVIGAVFFCALLCEIIINWTSYRKLLNL